MHFKGFQELGIRDINNKNFTLEELENIAKNYVEQGFSVCVGSDSQKFHDKTSLVTCVAFHKPSVGGDAYYIKQKIDNKFIPTLRSRMLIEVFASINAAFELKDFLGPNIEIHIDIGNDPKKCKTYEFKSELTSIVLAQGYVPKIKPKSWASHVADWFTKT